MKGTNFKLLINEAKKGHGTLFLSFLVNKINMKLAGNHQ